MAYELKPNTGTLFSNKSDNAAAPQLKGDALIDGKTYKMSCWFNKSKDGTKEYISCKFEAKADAPATDSSFASFKAAPAKDDLPF